MSDLTRRRRRALVLVYVAAFGSLATDCGTAHVRIAVAGHVNSTVTFTAHLSHDQDATITEVAVVECNQRVPLGSEPVMWRLSGT